MKKLIVKHKVIDIPYSPAVPAVPATETKPEIPEVPEQPEVSHEEIIAQTQGSVEELEIWLEGDKHKYPEGYWVEWIDITAEVDQVRINAESLKYLAVTDWLIIREVDAGIPCPVEVKLTRQQMRARIVR